MENQNENKKEYITLINVIACIAVVFLHTNGCFWDFSTAGYWKSANVLECLFYFAVPCFFMLTGANLIDFRERYSLKEYFIKRVRKAVIPFLFWSLVGAALVLISHQATVKSFADFYNGIVDTEFVSIYWFFPTLFCVYLSIPLFAAVEKKLRKEIFTYLAAAGFLFNCLIPFVFKAASLDLAHPLTVGVVAGYLIFPVIGYLICNYEMPKKWRIAVYILSIAAFLGHCIGTYLVSMEAQKVVKTFKGYSSAIGILYAVGIFVLLRYHGDKLMKNKVVQKIVHFISPYTLGIYLLQYFIYGGMQILFHVDTHSLLYRLGAPFVIIPLSILIVWVIKKIPILKHIVP